ncbi:MAG TPA: 1,2-phenylacetyl-CoA epoxidase subunit PaaC [Hyphomicrobiaceae bacterium]|nr:1,2-phenylacetyl-CoA epoxidase subunit PaaC [Hyphomicrobiaceae bacterium]
MSAETAGRPGPAPHASAAALVPYVLGLADDALVLGHRLSEWSGRGPTLEEDIALSNLALDLIGQARLCYAYAGEIEGRGRDEDALAYWRDEHAYRNLLLLEQPNGDFAMTMVRHLLYAAFLDPYFKALSASADARLAEIGAKAAKEMAYHLRHAAEWVIRLGDGTEESRARTAAALEELWMYTGEMFEMEAGETALSAQGIAVDRGTIKPAWEATLARVLAEASLARPADRWMQRGGRAGQHSEHLGRLLAEMQVLHRAHPGASW